ncbi:hypothetical protein G0Q06_06280 [Puniceicoccales bacterium CK1056]|uniref:Uncharacterized protein n=1 Tax=Oceanipulchritudo coccoides TaxID=2706888 RepID=A0A6B2LZG0_9BACT|nr:glycosyltransferase family 39 protein [Oceanipulchritudo coccoides]NDV62048.1 hypothetical protein [Oceanipulchritudo coccoides]
MIYLELIYSVLVFLATTGGLGLFFASFLKGEMLQRFTLGLGLTLFLLFGLFFFLYQTGLPFGCLTITPVISLLLLALRYRSLEESLREPGFRSSLLLYLMLSAWTLLCLAYIQTYNGGKWAGDWIEHYERALFFLKPLPLDHIFIGLYSFTARPPMGNALYAFFMAITEADFAHFQVFCSLLNLLVLFPALLLLKHFRTGKFNHFPAWILLLLLMTSPMFMQNALYAWTRLLCAFFILFSVYLFLRSEKDAGLFFRQAMAFASLAVALLVHYSAGPYVVACLFAYFFVSRDRLRKPRFWKETVWIGFTCALLLFVWFAWAIRVYGFSGTFLSNTAVTDVQDYTFLENVFKVFSNLFNSLVPHPLRGVSMDTAFSPADPLFAIRDYFFSIYQVSLFPMMGLMTIPVLFFHYKDNLFNSIRTGSAFRSISLWWFAGVVVLGVAVHGGYDSLGLAHICLQPLALLVVVFLAANFDRLSGRLKAILFAGIAFDFVFGVALHLQLLSTGPRDLLFFFIPGGQIELLQATIGHAAVANYQAQMFKGFTLLGELVSMPGWLFWTMALILISVVLIALARGRTREN